MRLPLTARILVLFAIALSFLVINIWPTEIPLDLYPELFLLLGVITTASHLGGVQDPAGWVVRPTGTLFITILYLFPPSLALIVAGLGHIMGSTLRRGWVTWRAMFNGAQVGISAALGSFFFRLFGGDPTSEISLSQLPAVAIAGLVYFAANDFFVSFFFSQVRRTRIMPSFLTSVRALMLPNFLSIPTALLLVILVARFHYVWVIAILAISGLEALGLGLYAQQRSTYLRVIESLVRAGEFEPLGVQGHARRVADIALLVGRELGLVEREIESLEYASLLHDVGMIAYDDHEALQSQPDWLREHARRGAEVASELSRREIAEIVANHHVRFEDAHRSREMPSLAARVLVLAEDVDSLLQGLPPYTEGCTWAAVLAHVDSERGRKFDPDVVDAFRRVAGDTAAILISTVHGSTTTA